MHPQKMTSIMNKVTENPFKTVERSSRGAQSAPSAGRKGTLGGLRTKKLSSSTMLMIVTALFVTLYLVSNVMAVKVVSLFGLFYFDAGTITFPLAYMLGDVLTEIWGYRTTRRVILLTLLCNVLMVVCTRIGVAMPSPDYLAETATAYNTIFDYVPRIVLGSLVGFLLGELSNSWCMARLKKLTEGRHLWLRTIGSSMVGYLFDSLPFVLIAFAGTVTLHDLVAMVVLQYVLKLAIEILFGTPLAYAAIGWIKRHTTAE